MPYGLGATEYTASATVTRQLTKQMRLLLRYGYFNYRDVTSGGHNNYQRAFALFESSNSVLNNQAIESSYENDRNPYV